MSRVVIFDKATGNVKRFLKSANTPEFSGRDDVLINPDTSSVDGIKPRYWKKDGSDIRAMTTAEKRALDAPVVNEEKRVKRVKSEIKAKLISDGWTEEQASYLLDRRI